MRMLLKSIGAAIALSLCAAPGQLMAEVANPTAGDPDLSLAALLHDPQTPSAGNPRGDLTIVEFFDYNCPFCMKAAPVIDALVKKDQGIRIIYKDWPIFGADSAYAARLALASNWQGKYGAVHLALMSAKRKVGQQQIHALVATAKVDMARLDADLAAHEAEITAVMARTEKQATAMNLPGTPIFLVGPLLINEALDLGGFEKAVAEARAKQGAQSN